MAQCNWIYKSVKCSTKMFKFGRQGGNAVMTWFANGSQLESTEYQTGDLVKQQLRLFALEIAAREFRRKHRKNCECCPVTLYSRITMKMLIFLFSIVRNVISVSSVKYLGLLFEDVL